MELREQIEKYIPYNEQEEYDKEMMLNYIDTFKDVLTRENKMCHCTASNWIVNKERTKVLMAYHNIYQSWQWPGGHADGNSNLLQVGLKEAREETVNKLLKYGKYLVAWEIVCGNKEKAKKIIYFMKEEIGWDCLTLEHTCAVLEKQQD